ncbi:MAG: alkaline phosphatase family protein [Ktedonobacteraceae bacterium]
MLNDASVQAVNEARFSQQFMKPLYDSYCFANLPATLEFLLTGNGQCSLPQDVFGGLPTHYDKVVFFFVDAFGWRFFERYTEKYDFLKIILEQGVASKITSQFPSTTAAHVTSIHTGLPVGQSGVYEWNYYEPLVDTLISPLLFSYVDYAEGEKLKRDTLKKANIPAEAFFPQQTLYDTLKAQGITSHVLQFQNYTPSTYSDIAFRGAKTHPYTSIQQALFYLSELVSVENTPPSYYFVYFDRIDALCHHYGPFSKEFESEVDDFFKAMHELFYKNIQSKVSNTLLIVTADHGQVEVNPKTTYYLDKELPDIKRYLKINRQGQVLAPAGSARDMFLYIHEEYVDETIALLRQKLEERAEVYATQELLAQHFFGAEEPSSTFLARLGNVVILPYKNETVWWSQQGKYEMRFLGHHGGLTREEMEIPLLLLAL